MVAPGDVAAWHERAASDCAADVAPACRRSASAVYDRRHDRFVTVFGRDAQRFYDDGWAFDLRELRWHRITATAAAPARQAAGPRLLPPAPGQQLTAEGRP